MYELVKAREAVDALLTLLRTTITPALSPVPADTTRGVHLAGRVPDDLPSDALGVHPHAVVHPSPGTPDPRFSGREGALTVSWQITCVGGTVTRCLSGADRVRAALDGARIQIPAGPSSGLITVPPGYDPGPARQAPGQVPVTAEAPRWYVPLQFRASF